MEESEIQELTINIELDAKLTKVKNQIWMDEELRLQNDKEVKSKIIDYILKNNRNISLF